MTTRHVSQTVTAALAVVGLGLGMMAMPAQAAGGSGIALEGGFTNTDIMDPTFESDVAANYRDGEGKVAFKTGRLGQAPNPPGISLDLTKKGQNPRLMGWNIECVPISLSPSGPLTDCPPLGQLDDIGAGGVRIFPNPAGPDVFTMDPDGLGEGMGFRFITNGGHLVVDAIAEINSGATCVSVADSLGVEAPLEEVLVIAHDVDNNLVNDGWTASSLVAPGVTEVTALVCDLVDNVLYGTAVISFELDMCAKGLECGF